MTKPRTTKSQDTAKSRSQLGMESVRLEYVHGFESTEALAAKHGMTHAAVRAACERQKWGDERKAFREKVRAEVAAEALEETKQREKETREAHYRIATLARAKLTRSLQNLPDDASPGKLKDASAAGLNVYKWVALALGMSTENRHVSGDNVIELVWPTKAKAQDNE